VVGEDVGRAVCSDVNEGAAEGDFEVGMIVDAAEGGLVVGLIVEGVPDG